MRTAAAHFVMRNLYLSG